MISTSTGTNEVRLAHLKQCLVENIQGKFQKNSLVTFISEESPSQFSGKTYSVLGRNRAIKDQLVAAYNSDF